MISVGITGGIGSGKSVVCRLFSLLGAPVFIADIESRRLLNTHPVIREMLVAEFGKDIYAGCFIDRQKFAEIVFSDPVKLRKANEIIHPAVRSAFLKWKSNQLAPVVIEEAAVLFESGAWRDMDKTIVVTAPEAIRVGRVMARDGLSEEQVYSRMRHQMPDNEKIAWADFVIENDDVQAVMPQVLKIYTTLSEYR